MSVHTVACTGRNQVFKVLAVDVVAQQFTVQARLAAVCAIQQLSGDVIRLSRARQGTYRLAWICDNPEEIARFPVFMLSRHSQPSIYRRHHAAQHPL